MRRGVCTASTKGSIIMDMIGQQRIFASRDAVWKALNDPKILKTSIPGCEELIKLSDTDMAATAVIKVGPVKAKFQGAVTLSELDPPNGYRITGEGKGGIAGFAKGGATVRLEDDGAATILHYNVSAEVGGKLSQLGGRLIDATARQMSSAFFRKFSDEIARGDNVANTPPQTRQSQNQTQSGLQSASAVNGPKLTSYAYIGSLLLLCAVLAGFWYVFGSSFPSLVPTESGRAHVSADFASGLVLIVVASIGFLLGRQTSAR
jgi:carbon monoxide dehydrogenase subunit G